MQAQAMSPTFTHVYAALVAVINTKFPEISELLLKRLIVFRRNDKLACLSSVRFIAHLLNQKVAHEVLVLEILTLLLENPTDHSVEVAVAMLKECGKRLNELSRKGFEDIFSRLRNVLHEASINKRTQYMIEVMFAVRKDKFKDYPAVVPELDLVEETDEFTHLVTLDEAVDAEELLNVFKFDPEYEANEEHYRSLVKEILGESSSEESGGSEGEESGSEEESDCEGGESRQIVDMAETNLGALCHNIYLTVQPSLDFEECAHKLLKMSLKPGEIVLSNIRLNENDTTSSSRTFIKMLFQELCKYMRLPLLNARVKDIDELREHLKTAPKNPVVAVVPNERPDESDSSSSSSSSSTSSSSSSSSSSSPSDSEDEEPPRKRKKSSRKRDR